MAKEKGTRHAPSPERPPALLRCFDADLSVRRRLFEESVIVCDLSVSVLPEVPIGHPDMLRFGDYTADLSHVLGLLHPLAERKGWTYYLHHHDNIVVELARLAPYSRAAFRRALHLFRTHPADEGGANLLGVVGPRLAWLLVAENDNAGAFRVEFFGPSEVCHELRSRLVQQ